jgi:hypothetical protein
MWLMWCGREPTHLCWQVSVCGWWGPQLFLDIRRWGVNTSGVQRWLTWLTWCGNGRTH